MGLNFQTCTIINSNVDVDSKGKKLFEAIKTKVDGKEVDALKVKRDFLFVKDNVKSIRMRAGYEAMACKATIDFAELMSEIKPEKGNNYCRLDVYVKWEGQEPFYGANQMHIQKGIPFWVEFTVKKDAEAAAVAAEVEKILKKNHIFLVDKDLIEVSVEGAVMTLTGATEYQRFRKIEVVAFNATDDYAEGVSEMVKAHEDGYDDAAIKETVRGKNAFGTYSQIVKDLRLPTAANYQWTHIRQAETPIVDGIYNQYIIEYCAPASNEGLGAVGAKLESHTTHVFWVKRESAEEAGALITEWETALATIGFEAEGGSEEPADDPESPELDA